MGAPSAALAARELVEQGVRALMSWGTCGALVSALHPGTVVVPRTVLNGNGVAYPVEPEWRNRLCRQIIIEGLPISVGHLLSVERPIMRVADKASAHAVTAAVAVDMESAAVAEVAAAAELPFLALRAVVDCANQALPEVVLSGCDIYGRPRKLAWLAAITLHPIQAFQLAELAKSFSAAKQSLRRVSRMHPGSLAFGQDTISVTTR